ncbi:hypothetical protein [Nocardia ignorata]|uniref:Uncharacterized protein n=1 Tax=Nocardia ignorata TaxID=145285 RepID=A0A4R6PU09_NOCIG|nr:hypothetical protein [Nocardia ignorata]TDP42022.1 hypothetical protein DFR75_1011128 [Nocardia ignorata]
MADNEKSGAMLSVRSALIFLCALIAGVGASVLTTFARHSPYEATLIGVAAAASATKFLHWLIR